MVGSCEGHRERRWASREQVLYRHDIRSSEQKETPTWSRGRGKGDSQLLGGVFQILQLIASWGMGSPAAMSR